MELILEPALRVQAEGQPWLVAGAHRGIPLVGKGTRALVFIRDSCREVTARSCGGSTGFPPTWATNLWATQEKLKSPASSPGSGRVPSTGKRLLLLLACFLFSTVCTEHIINKIQFFLRERERETHHVAPVALKLAVRIYRAGLECVVILLPIPPDYLDYKCALPHLANTFSCSF